MKVKITLKQWIMLIPFLGGLVCMIISFIGGQYLIGTLSFLTVLVPVAIWNSDYKDSRKQRVQLIKLKENVESLGMTVVDNPEWMWVMTDAVDHILFGIRKDASVDWSVGVPAPIRKELDEIRQRIKELEGKEK